MGPRARLRRARARDTLPRAVALRPVPCMLPPGASRPSSLPVFPRLKICPFRVPLTSNRAGLAPSWMTRCGRARGSWRKSNARVLASPVLTQPLQTLFSYPLALSGLSQPLDSPLQSLLYPLILTPCLPYPETSRLQDLRCRAMEIVDHPKPPTPLVSTPPFKKSKP